MLKSPQEYRVWPNLGSFHRLMIDLSLAKKADLVLETVGLINARDDIKPTDETYGIAIRCGAGACSRS